MLILWLLSLEIYQLISLFQTYVLPFVFGLFGVLSFFFYAKTKKKGFVMFGVAFVVQTASLVTYYAFSRYFFTALGGKSFASYVNLESSFIFATSMIFVILLLAGLILLYREKETKTTQQSQDAKILRYYPSLFFFVGSENIAARRARKPFLTISGTVMRAS